MLKENQIVTAEIVDMGHKGEAIGKVQGFTVFVDGAIKGDLVQAKITKAKKNYAVGDLLEVLQPSSDRVEPRCSITGICGGCSIMNMDYGKQLELKKNLIHENLTRIGKIDQPNISQMIGMKDPYHYRNKAQYPIGKNAQGQIEIGFYKKRSHDIVEFDTCHIQHESNDAIIRQIKAYVEKNKVSIYDENTKKGALRRIVTKMGFATGEIMVIFVTKDDKDHGLSQLAQELAAETPNIKSIIQNINPSSGNAILGRNNKLLYGKDTITDKIGDLAFEISAHSFYQVNPVQTEVMYSKAMEYMGLTGRETVFDLYCGIGTISLFLAQKAKKVYGIEIVPEAIEDAKRNAKLNGMDNTEFIVGKAEEEVPKLYARGITADAIVVDPPRKGIEEIVLQTIAKMQVPKIVYVSCNPSTMARDVEILGRLGYELKECVGVDNFCHSMHVETVCLLSHKNADTHININVEFGDEYGQIPIDEIAIKT